MLYLWDRVDLLTVFLDRKVRETIMYQKTEEELVRQHNILVKAMMTVETQEGWEILNDKTIEIERELQERRDFKDIHALF